MGVGGAWTERCDLCERCVGGSWGGRVGDGIVVVRGDRSVATVF